MRQVADSYHRTVRSTFLLNVVPTTFAASQGQHHVGETVERKRRDNCSPAINQSGLVRLCPSMYVDKEAEPYTFRRACCLSYSVENV